MLPILQVGPLTLRTPGLALLAGIWFGLEVASRAGLRRGIAEDKIYNIGFYALIVGVLGARFAFVLAHLRLYTRISPWNRALGSVFALAPGTEIAWVGAVISLGLVVFLIRRDKLNALQVLDSFAPGIALMLVGIGLAAFLDGAMLGLQTTLPWGIPLQGVTRHPVPLYLVVIAVAAYIISYRMRPLEVLSKGKSKINTQPTYALQLPDGVTFQVIVAVFGLGLLFIEPLRADSPVILAGLRLWSVLGLMFLLAALAGFIIRPMETTEESP